MFCHYLKTQEGSIILKSTTCWIQYNIIYDVSQHKAEWWHFLYSNLARSYSQLIPRLFRKSNPHHYIQMSQKYKSNTINIGPTQEAAKRDHKWYIPSPRAWSITAFTSDILVHSSNFKPINQFLLIKGSSPNLKQPIWNMESWKANKKMWDSMNLMWVVWLKPGK